MSRQHRAFSLIELLVTIALVALLVSILLPALASARRSGRTAVCQSNLRQLGIAQSNYATDSKDYLGVFNGLSKDSTRAPGPFHFPAINHCERQARDVLDRVKSVTLSPFNSGIYAGSDIPIVHEQYSHLVLTDYMGGTAPMPASVCPEDRSRLAWQADPSGINASPSRPAKPKNALNISWFPYSSSYQLLPAAWAKDHLDIKRHHGVLIYSHFIRPIVSGVTHDVYGVTAYQVGGTKTDDISFPSGKVSYADSQSRHFGRADLYYAYSEARQPLSFWDGSVRMILTKDANKGWDPTQDTPGKGAASFQYLPDPGFESPLPAGHSAQVAGYYKWTRGGLKGVDVGGAEIGLTK